MKKILIALFLTLNTSIAFAQPTAQDLAVGCGLPAVNCTQAIVDLTDGTFPGSFTSITATGAITAGTGLGISGSGTLSLQEATAGTKCMGTVTATGTTAVVVSTTCAKTASRIFIARSSLPSGTAQCTTQTIVNNTSFELDCDGAETGTFNWFIINESA